MEDYFLYNNFDPDKSPRAKNHSESRGNIGPSQNEKETANPTFIKGRPVTTVPPSIPEQQSHPNSFTFNTEQSFYGIPESKEPEKELDFDLYFSYNTDPEQPISSNEIHSIFEDVCEIFGFQKDNCENAYELFMSQLDSKSSRGSAGNALVSLHADYIGGEHANYRKWYFCAMLETDSDLLDGVESLKKVNQNNMIYQTLISILPKNLNLLSTSGEEKCMI